MTDSNVQSGEVVNVCQKAYSYNRVFEISYDMIFCQRSLITCTKSVHLLNGKFCILTWPKWAKKVPNLVWKFEEMYLPNNSLLCIDIL
jgi:hypothetical protein